MSRFLLGDELGNIKILHYSNSEEPKCTVKTIYRRDSTPRNGVQHLATSSQSIVAKTPLAAAFSDGSCFLSTVSADDTHEVILQWEEPHIASNKFIGMSLNESSVYTCTSNGILRRVPFVIEEEKGRLEESQFATLPTRLCDWRLSGNGESFAYGGDEVDLSVWNTELAFQPQQTSTASSALSKKRKRIDDLFPGEIWRARNVPNDHLGLRQPIRITALTYSAYSSATCHLVTGTQFGDIRGYDTRAARRPISNWVGVGKVGGVKSIEKGISEFELFMSDNSSTLSSIDLRTGGILYSYKGLSGAVSSMAQSPTVLVSVALDRYARVHSVVTPPSQARTHQDRKGEVLEKSYLTSSPTAVVWDKCLSKKVLVENPGDEDEEVWDKMEHVGY
ncbi:hypothetical protein GALMADRAFT_239587 [Galerina marginata CBS 339.88]|uniref:Ribosome biogenesis protein NSA1 n=1 Tax=Galerina marginata (strain CBS 339.88) TaxID=685588 RepID=A0A067TRH4_GALM3|nr:hypothetical protein GALMADRAFT_239587 [Galerina marginata CBS 339.88]